MDKIIDINDLKEEQIVAICDELLRVMAKEEPDWETIIEYPAHSSDPFLVRTFSDKLDIQLEFTILYDELLRDPNLRGVLMIQFGKQDFSFDLNVMRGRSEKEREAKIHLSEKFIKDIAEALEPGQKGTDFWEQGEEYQEDLAKQAQKMLDSFKKF